MSSSTPNLYTTADDKGSADYELLPNSVSTAIAEMQRFDRQTGSGDQAHDGELLEPKRSFVNVETRPKEFQQRQTKSCGDLYNLEHFPLEYEWSSPSVEALQVPREGESSLDFLYNLEHFPLEYEWNSPSECEMTSESSSFSDSSYTVSSFSDSSSYATTTSPTESTTWSYTISMSSSYDSLNQPPTARSHHTDSSWADGGKDDSAYCLPLYSSRPLRSDFYTVSRDSSDAEEVFGSEVSFGSKLIKGKFIPPFDPVKEVRKLALRAVDVDDFLGLTPEYLLSYVFFDYRMLLRQMLNKGKELKQTSQQVNKCDCVLM
uniref:Uncharacterized protein n=2 Tax=Meloidogyne enterolobii TaxID=390850 RepID=A0A6V7VBM7_MELEN|nr:unnamed protein product [Meloidogyne enterolobii]